MRPLLILLFCISSLSITVQKVGINTNFPEVDLDIRAFNDLDHVGFSLSSPNKSRFLELYSGSDVLAILRVRLL